MRQLITAGDLREKLGDPIKKPARVVTRKGVLFLFERMGIVFLIWGAAVVVSHQIASPRPVWVILLSLMWFALCTWIFAGLFLNRGIDFDPDDGLLHTFDKISWRWGKPYGSPDDPHPSSQLILASPPRNPWKQIWRVADIWMMSTASEGDGVKSIRLRNFPIKAVVGILAIQKYRKMIEVRQSELASLQSETLLAILEMLEMIVALLGEQPDLLRSYLGPRSTYSAQMERLIQLQSADMLARGIDVPSPDIGLEAGHPDRKWYPSLHETASETEELSTTAQEPSQDQASES